MDVIDLRSDFLTRPTPAMRDAMNAVSREPGQFGLRENPRQQALERRIAEMLGTEDALLFPTCTMANEVALMLLARPGDVVAAQPDVHIITSEAGAPAVLGGLSVVAVAQDPPMPPLSAWEAMARQTSDELKPRVVAFALENTHNRSGGTVLPLAYTRDVVAIAKAAGIAVHLDGARLFNAAVALGVEPKALCESCDTVAISLNKALGAPIGAALASSRAQIVRALVHRQRLGGGIRPTGLIAAAALVGLEDWRSLADDHRRARRLAELVAVRGLVVDPEVVETNIVAVGLARGGPTPEVFCERLARSGVLALPFGPARVRLVTYRDIGDAEIERAAAIIRHAIEP